MIVHFCVEGHPYVFHKQEFNDISPLLLMKDAGTLMKFSAEQEGSCFIEARIIKTSFETILDSSGEIKEQFLAVHLFVEDEDLKKRFVHHVTSSI
ncbi:hypothetical protein QTG56_09810 [Rossellomorea sp. AcN35-11]|nr:hypothetical protein [Rossellomorea aquimaris]NMH68549.1 hypothetical protein [Bacillus sp. RO3]WJV31218.1 hypothetical protein QTG56_09810 [Rossellomorea sp. AcN35-11]